jgi:hypothetical protein
MPQLIEWLYLVGALATVGGPLLYAVGTLKGMQHKTIYPVFRFVKKNGRLLSREAPSS